MQEHIPRRLGPQGQGDILDFLRGIRQTGQKRQFGRVDRLGFRHAAQAQGHPAHGQGCGFTFPLCSLLLTEIGIAKPDEGQAGGVTRRQAPQAGEGRHRGQLRHGKLAHQPRHLAISGKEDRRGRQGGLRLRDQQGQGQLAQLGMRHRQHDLGALKDIAHRRQQGLIETMRRRQIEGGNLVDRRDIRIQRSPQPRHIFCNDSTVGGQGGKATAPVRRNGPDLCPPSPEIPGHQHLAGLQHFLHLLDTHRRRIHQARVIGELRADFPLQALPLFAQRLNISPNLGLNDRQLLVRRGCQQLGQQIVERICPALRILLLPRQIGQLGITDRRPRRTARQGPLHRTASCLIRQDKGFICHIGLQQALVLHFSQQAQIALDQQHQALLPAHAAGLCLDIVVHALDQARHRASETSQRIRQLAGIGFRHGHEGADLCRAQGLVAILLTRTRQHVAGHLHGFVGTRTADQGLNDIEVPFLQLRLQVGIPGHRFQHGIVAGQCLRIVAHRHLRCNHRARCGYRRPGIRRRTAFPD